MNFTVPCDVVPCGLRGSKQGFLRDGRASSLLMMETAVNCSQIFARWPKSKSHIQEDSIQSDQNQEVVYAYVLFKAGSTMGRRCEDVLKVWHSRCVRSIIQSCSIYIYIYIYRVMFSIDVTS